MESGYLTQKLQENILLFALFVLLVALSSLSTQTHHSFLKTFLFAPNAIALGLLVFLVKFYSGSPLLLFKGLVKVKAQIKIIRS